MPFLNSCLFSFVVRGRAIFTAQQGWWRIIFGTKKSQDLCRHKSAKIIGLYQYLYEKSVGPVNAMAVGYFLIQWVQGRSLVEVQGVKPWKLRGSSILHYQEMVKNNKIVSTFEFMGKIVPSCLIRLQKHLER